MALVTDASTNPDPKTGTRRVNLWREDASGGQWGDNARGYGYSATYVSDDGYGCAEVGIYPVEYEDGSYGVDEQATIGRAVWGECYACHGSGTSHGAAGSGRFVCRACGGTGEPPPDADREGVTPRPDDSADISYEGGSALAFATLEDAQREADRLGQEDQSFAIYLRKR
jgi:hypothetical protein